jgi:flagellar motility protein MotE (MotC chaperone)
MKDPIQTIVVGLIALVLGATVAWFVASSQQPSETPNSNDVSSTATGNQPCASALDEPEHKDGTDSIEQSAKLADLQKLLDESNKHAGELQTENDRLKQDKVDLEKEKTTLEGKVEELKQQIEAASQPEDSGKHLPINFGRWDKVEGLRNANWKEIGDVYNKMEAIVKERVKAVREGREPDPESQKKLGELNKKLQNHLVSFFNKLPSNSGPNGQFTHPANLVNTLAGQLEAAELPLTEDQIDQLEQLGDEYDKKWEALQKGYTDKTWDLQKLVDECELKEWFHDEMFKVCTAQQKEAAMPAEIEGVIGADFYSAGLVLNMGIVNPVNAADTAELKSQLRNLVAGRTGLSQETMDAADYLFDDWLNTLSGQLGPRTQIEASLMHCWDAIHAGRAQLTALKALSDNYAATPEAKNKIAAIMRIALPQIVTPE